MRPAPSSCCHRPNIICTYLHFRQTIRLFRRHFFIPTRISIISHSFRSCFRCRDKFITAHPDNAHTYTYTHFHNRQHGPKAMSKKGTQTAGVCGSATVNSRRSVRIPSRFISVLSFQLLSRCINGSRVFPVC